MPSIGKLAMLKPCDVGHRVVVRRRVGPGPRGRMMFTDLTGDLVAMDEAAVRVRTEDGREHSVALDEIAAGKRIGPRPARYSEIISLERVADRAWPAPDREWLGEWLLRSADGFTSRANSALPLGSAGVATPDAIAACRDWYAQRHLPPKITVPLPVRRDVATALTTAGWVGQPVVLVQTAPIRGVADGASATESPPVLLRPEPSAEFLGIIAARKSGLPDAAQHVLTEVPAVRFAEVRDGDGSLLATARGAVVDGWLHIGLVEVVPEARRRGLARAASAALAGWARRPEVGATRAVLQVERTNEAAISLYARLGFRTHHEYVTFRYDG